MPHENLVAELSPDAFDQEVLASPQTVLVEFRTEWCPPCKALAPVLEQLAADFSQRLKIFTVDVQRALPLARQFKIEAVPTLLIYHQGKLTHRLQGAPSRGVLLQKLALSSPQSTTT